MQAPWRLNGRVVRLWTVQALSVVSSNLSGNMGWSDLGVRGLILHLQADTRGMPAVNGATEGLVTGLKWEELRWEMWPRHYF